MRKKPLFLLCFPIILLAFALTACGDYFTQAVTLADGLQHTYENGEWVATADAVKSGYTKRTVTFKEGNLNVFHAESKVAEGRLVLKIIQGDKSKDIDISDINDFIDMSDFSTGKIVIELQYHSVQTMRTVLNWRI